MRHDSWSAEAASRSISAGICLLAGIAIVAVVNWNDRRLALHEAEDKALLLIDRNVAAHAYINSILQPPFLAITGAGSRADHFDPAWMSSSFVVRGASGRASASASAERYSYKDAAINARNPDNEADESERAFLEQASLPAGPERWSGVKTIDGRPWFVTMRRGERMEAACLRCHDSPGRAPGDIVRQYGPARGFGRRVGELVSVVSIRIPLDDAFASANAFSARLGGILAAVLAFIYLATALVNRRLVFGPLLRVQQHAAAVATGQRSVAERLPWPRGRDMQGLAAAFDAMSSQLHGQRDELERQVAARTSEAMSSEARYQMLFDANPMPMWVYAVDSAAFVAVNAAAIDHYGYTRDEFLRMTLRDIRPADEVARFEMARLQLPRSRSRTGLFHHVKKSGEVISVEIVSHELQFLGRRCRLVLASDVTEQVQAERALRDSEEQYRIVADGIPMRVCHIDLDRRYRFVNRAFEDDLGRSRNEIVGRTVREVFGDEAYERLRAHIEAALRGERVMFEATLDLERGRRVYDVAYVPRLDDRGAVAGFISIAEDVTETRELERQFRQSQKMEAVGQLAGGVAHDFNNLLTVISSVAHLLSESDRLGTEERLDVSEIQQAAARAADLTRKLLAFSSKQTLQPRCVSIDAVVTDAEKMLRRLIREDIDLGTALGAGESGWVLADPAQLDQVLMNLVVNARDAMPAGGTIAVRSAAVDVDEERARVLAGLKPGRYVLITVEDSGTGMSPDVVAHAFEPFFTTKEPGRGTGLGLATVYGIVTQSGGHVQIASAPGRGTKVSIHLPRIDPRGDARRDPAPSAKAPGGSETVLLVEDEETVRRVAQRALEARGYSVLCAANGEEALQVVARLDRRIALVVTDVIMPAMGGVELARRLARVLPAPVPVLFMSGYASGELGDNGVIDSAVWFIQKPFTADGLCGAVREALDGARDRATV